MRKILLSLLTLWSLLSPVVMSGCEAERSLGSEVQSGDRLVARYWVAPDGTEIFADWYDTELDVTCTPAQPADGPLRCLPVPRVGLGASSEMAPFVVARYADAACAQRVLWRRDDCAPPTLSALWEGDFCTTHLTVYQIQGELTPSALYSRDEQTGDCVFHGDPHEDGQYLHLGEALDPSVFVALEEQGIGGGGRLRQRFYRGADGSLLPRDLWDAELQTPCLTGHDADGGRRCLPFTESLGFQFADDQCLTPLVTWSGGANGCTPPDHSYARVGVIHSCTFRSRIYALGPLTEDVTPYSISTEGTCESSIPPGAQGPFMGWVSTGELPPDTFASLDATRLVGQGRIQRLVHEDGAGFVATEQLWDTQLGQTCRPLFMADTTWRCAPSTRGSVRRTYADSLCTVEAPSILVLTTVNPQGCGESPVGEYATEGLDGCDAGHRIFEVGEALDGSPLYEVNSQGECQEAVLAGQYSVAAELPAASLVELTRQER